MPKKKGKGRVVITNIRVEKDTHNRIKTLADLWGVTMSEAMDMLITEHVPEVEEAIKLREEMKRKAEKNRPDTET